MKQKSTANVLIIGIGGKLINDAIDNLVKGHAKKVIYDILRRGQISIISFKDKKIRFCNHNISNFKVNYSILMVIRMDPVVIVRTPGKLTIIKRLGAATSKNQKDLVLKDNILLSMLHPVQQNATVSKILLIILLMEPAWKSILAVHVRRER